MGCSSGTCTLAEVPGPVKNGHVAGDRIVIDAEAHTIDLLVDGTTLEQRRAGWKPRAPRYTTGFLAKYAKLAQGAETGAITNF